MKGIKHYPVVSFVLFVCELIAVIMVTMCFQYRKEYDDSDDKDQGMYRLVYYVSYADHGFYEEDAEYLLDSMRKIAEQYEINQVQVKNYEDILISGDRMKSGEKIENSLLTFLSDREQSDKDIRYEMMDEKEMTKEYTELYNMALKKGIHIEVYQHDEANDQQTEQVGKRMYRLFMFGTVILVNFINIISILTWLRRRKKEYIIKYFFGESPGKLQISFGRDFLLVLLSAFLFFLFIVAVQSPDRIRYVVKCEIRYLFFALIQFIVLIKLNRTKMA